MKNLLFPPLDVEMVDRLYELFEGHPDRWEHVRRLAIVAWHDGYGPQNARHRMGTLLNEYIRELVGAATDTSANFGGSQLAHLAIAALLNFRVIETLADRALRQVIQAYRDEAPTQDEILPWVDVKHFDHQAQAELAEAQLFIRGLDDILSPLRAAAQSLQRGNALEPDWTFDLVASKPGTDPVACHIPYDAMLGLATYEVADAASDLDNLLSGMCEIVAEATDNMLSKVTYDPRSVCALVNDKRQEAIDREVEPMQNEARCAGTDLDEVIGMLVTLKGGCEAAKEKNLPLIDQLAMILDHSRAAMSHLDAIEMRWPEGGSPSDAAMRFASIASWVRAHHVQLGEQVPAVAPYLDMLCCVAQDSLTALGGSPTLREYAFAEKGHGHPMVGKRRDCGCMQVDYVVDEEARVAFIERCDEHAPPTAADILRAQMEGRQDRVPAEVIGEGRTVMVEPRSVDETVLDQLARKDEMVDEIVAGAGVPEQVLWPKGETHHVGKATGPRPTETFEHGEGGKLTMTRHPERIYAGYVKPSPGKDDDSVICTVVVEQEGCESRPLEIHRIERFGADEHNWGYLGPEPAQLARDILWDVNGTEPTPEQSQHFLEERIGGLEINEPFKFGEQRVYADDAKWHQKQDGKVYRGTLMPGGITFSVMVLEKGEENRFLGPIHPSDAPEHLSRWYDVGDHLDMAENMLNDVTGDDPTPAQVDFVGRKVFDLPGSHWEIAEQEIRNWIVEVARQGTD